MGREETRKYLKQLNTPEKMQNYLRQAELRIRSEYDKRYKEELLKAIDLMLFTVRYTLHFNEETKFNQERIDDFMDDLIVTIDNFRTGDFNVNDYKEQLKADGIVFESKEESK